jgi:hypothetical protein
MQFYHLENCPDDSVDFEAKEAITGKKVAVAISGLGIVAALGAAALGYGPAVLDYALAAFAMVLNAVTISAVRHARRPTNWLLRVSGDRVRIKFRSFMNDNFPTDEIQIVGFDRSEVAWVRDLKIRFHLDKNVYRRGEGLQIARRYLEIGLTNANFAELDKLLSAERSHPCVGKGRIKTKSDDCPIQTDGCGALRVRWHDSGSQITPNLKTALEFFSQWAELRPPHRETLHCSAIMLAELPTDEQDAVLRQASFVSSMAASSTMCQLRGCSLAEAQELVDRL